MHLNHLVEIARLASVVKANNWLGACLNLLTVDKPEDKDTFSVSKQIDQTFIEPTDG